MNYLIIGYGVTGKEGVAFCKKNSLSYYIFDHKAQDNQEKIYNNEYDLPWDSIDKAILSPGIPTWSTLPLIVILCRQKGIPIFSDLDILYHFNGNKKFIGITGSQGKTTIHDAINKLLIQKGENISMGGNNGVGALSLMGDNYLLEVSMQQLWITQSILFNTAIFNNFFDTHQEFGDFNFRLQSKRKLLTTGNGMKQRFIVGDFPQGTIELLGSAIQPNTIGVYSYNFHRRENILLKNFVFIDYDEEKDHHLLIYNIDDVQNQFIIPKNLLFKLLAEENLGILWAFIVTHGENNSVKFLEFLTNYETVDHRLSLIHWENHWQFFNASKCTNGFAFTSITKNIAYNYPGKNYWILGGILNSPLENFIIKYLSNDNFYIMGRDGCLIYDYLKDVYNCQLFNNLNDVMEKIFYDLSQDDQYNINIILAPGCQSFDQFKNFEERGELFVKLIKNKYN